MHSLRLYAGTEDGLESYRYTGGGNDTREGDVLESIGTSLEGTAVRSISVHPGDPDRAYVGCGLRGWGLHLTDDGGRTTTSLGFDDAWVWGVALDPIDPETLYVGTEPPALYRSTDGGETFEEFEGIQSLSSRSDWTFFHEPFRAGHLHGFASHPDRPERLFAGVEHGALVYTRDGGATWREALVGRDLHRIAIDPLDPDRVLAGAGSGLYESTDAGGSWERLEDLRGAYVHGIEFAPTDSTRVYVYVDGPSPIRRSDDGGRTWLEAGADLPAASPADPIVVDPRDPDRLRYAGDRDGGSVLFASRDGGERWTEVAEFESKVWRLVGVLEP